MGNSAARNALDIVRAAQNLAATHAGSEFMTMGWSQGGHAGLFVGEELHSAKRRRARDFRCSGMLVIAR
jgi:hypothetical protein